MDRVIFRVHFFGARPKLHEGGFADKYPKGAEYLKRAKYPKGKPQLNRLEGGFEPDLNYFFPTQCDRVPWSFERNSNRALPIPFREGGWGVRSIPGAFELDSFRSRTAVNLRFPQVIHTPRPIKEYFTFSAVQKLPRVAQSPRSGS
jgi:hypothetical protein